MASNGHDPIDLRTASAAEVLIAANANAAFAAKQLDQDHVVAAQSLSVARRCFAAARERCEELGAQRWEVDVQEARALASFGDHPAVEALVGHYVADAEALVDPERARQAWEVIGDALWQVGTAGGIRPVPELSDEQRERFLTARQELVGLGAGDRMGELYSQVSAVDVVVAQDIVRQERDVPHRPSQMAGDLPVLLRSSKASVQAARAQGLPQELAPQQMYPLIVFAAQGAETASMGHGDPGEDAATIEAAHDLVDTIVAAYDEMFGKDATTAFLDSLARPLPGGPTGPLNVAPSFLAASLVGRRALGDAITRYVQDPKRGRQLAEVASKHAKRLRKMAVDDDHLATQESYIQRLASLSIEQMERAIAELPLDRWTLALHDVAVELANSEEMGLFPKPEEVAGAAYPLMVRMEAARAAYGDEALFGKRSSELDDAVIAEAMSDEHLLAVLGIHQRTGELDAFASAALKARVDDERFERTLTLLDGELERGSELHLATASLIGGRLRALDDSDPRRGPLASRFVHEVMASIAGNERQISDNDWSLVSGTSTTFEADDVLDAAAEQLQVVGRFEGPDAGMDVGAIACTAAWCTALGREEAVVAADVEQIWTSALQTIDAEDADQQAYFLAAFEGGDDAPARLLELRDAYVAGLAPERRELFEQARVWVLASEERWQEAADCATDAGSAIDVATLAGLGNGIGATATELPAPALDDGHDLRPDIKLAHGARRVARGTQQPQPTSGAGDREVLGAGAQQELPTSATSDEGRPGAPGPAKRPKPGQPPQNGLGLG